MTEQRLALHLYRCSSGPLTSAFIGFNSAVIVSKAGRPRSAFTASSKAFSFSCTRNPNCLICTFLHWTERVTWEA